MQSRPIEKNETKKEIPLILVTGFLGSGKTSVLNSLLKQLKGKRIGLILNDFGKINIDVSLIPAENGIIKRELNGGQLFCSCLSGNFVDTVVQLGALDPDLILIETSGLSKPTPLLEIISWIQEKNPNRFSYWGMVCVIDAERFLSLSALLLTLEEQVAFSDLFVINKTDLVNENTLHEVMASLKRIQPTAKVVQTCQGSLSLQLFDGHLRGKRQQYPSGEKYGGWGIDGRPKTCLFNPPTLVSLDVLAELMKSCSCFFYRIKGFLRTRERENVYISTVGSQIEIRKIPSQEEAQIEGLVCIYQATFPGDKKISGVWQDLTGESYCPEIL